MTAQNKVALITGGGTGIGQSAALALQGDGWNVVVTGRRKEELDKTVALAKPGGGKLVAIPANVTSQDEVKRLFAETLASFGRLDFLFNNAGTGAPAIPMEELTLAQWQSVVDVNLTAVFLCAQEAIRIMRARRRRAGASSITARSRRMRRARTRSPTRRPSTR